MKKTRRFNGASGYRNAAGDAPYQGTDGTWYIDTFDASGNFVSTIPLQYYDAASGDYAEEGDDTIYDAAGNDTGMTMADVSGGTSNQPNWWQQLAIAGVGSLGGVIGKSGNTIVKNPSSTTGTKPSAPKKGFLGINSTSGMIFAVLAIGAVIFVVVKVSKKNK